MRVIQEVLDLVFLIAGALFLVSLPVVVLLRVGGV